MRDGMVKIFIMSKNISKISLYAFYIIALGNLISQVSKLEMLEFITKPLITISLLIHFLSSDMGKKGHLTLFMAGALVFSWVGDVFMLVQHYHEEYFIFGLSGFLLAQVCYIFAYRKARFGRQMQSYQSFIQLRIFFLIFIGVAVMWLLYPVLGNMLIPVALYTLIIISMGIAALLRRGWTSEKSFMMVYSGALLFILSDAMIGINKFMDPIVQANLLIMATYITAQFLIVKGIIAHGQAIEEPAKATAE